MKRVVVTGATSMIGVALIRECIRNQVEVMAIVRRQSVRLDRLPNSAFVTVCECELDELNSITADEKKYDAFYHLAWGYTSKADRDHPVLQEMNIKYTLDAVELARRLGCDKFIGAGSQAEYGKVDHIILPDTKAEPLISYGIAKYAAGKLSAKLCSRYGMTHIWGRVFSVYGRYDNEGTMINYAVDSFLKKETARFSAATQLWDYLHEKDAGRIFYLLGERVVENKVYCIASGKSRPLKEFILEIRDILGPDMKCEFASDTDAGFISLETDISGLARDTGFCPQVPFREGILDLVPYRRQKLGCQE